jgi:hypothetical protein
MRALDADDGVVAIEDDKPEAIAAIEVSAAQRRREHHAARVSCRLSIRKARSASSSRR